MPKLAANLFFQFTDLALMDRFAAAQRLGFRSVELPYPYQVSIDLVCDTLKRTGLEVCLINAPVGDWQAGERGFATHGGRDQEFVRSIEEACAAAIALNCPNIHVMAGTPPRGTTDQAALGTLLKNLDIACSLARKNGLQVLLEPINKIDFPGYFICDTDMALEVIKLSGHENLRLLYDIYHATMNGADVFQEIEHNIDLIGHMQIAGVPGRHEPSGGQLDTPRLFALIDSLAYDQWIGCEYTPLISTQDGIQWATPYGIGLSTE